MLRWLLSFDIAAIFQRHRSLLLGIYMIGVFLMLVFNANCYRGTVVGKVGWAFIWPLSLPAYIMEFFMQPDGVLAASCFLT